MTEPAVPHSPTVTPAGDFVVRTTLDTLNRAGIVCHYDDLIVEKPARIRVRDLKEPSLRGEVGQSVRITAQLRHLDQPTLLATLSRALHRVQEDAGPLSDRDVRNRFENGPRPTSEKALERFLDEHLAQGGARTQLEYALLKATMEYVGELLFEPVPEVLTVQACTDFANRPAVQALAGKTAVRSGPSLG